MHDGTNSDFRETVASILNAVLSSTSLCFVCCACLVAPWFFGAWEMWWFWLFASCVFVALLMFAFRLILNRVSSVTDPICRPSLTRWLIITATPFLLYAIVRAYQAEVAMDAERSLMLFLTAFALTIVVVFGFSIRQLWLFHWLVILNLALLVLYGLVNHYLTGSAKVLWVTSEYTQYAGRATGTYFCPDHFSGVAELLFAMALGMILAGRSRDPQSRRHDRPLIRGLAALPLLAISIAAVLISKSRGGGITIIVICLAALCIGFTHLRPIARWGLRAAAAAAIVIALGLLWNSDLTYVNRFKAFFAWEKAQGRPWPEMRTQVMTGVKASTRYNMYAAALRAWQTKPAFGIGPGMHQHLWPHFAPSPDGDPETGRWPTRANYNYHSYEVHSDWIQLLQEYGTVGLVLFLPLLASLTFALLTGVYSRTAHTIALSAALSVVCMTFHSLGDFNLQMPGTVWLLAGIVSTGIAGVVRGRVGDAT